jgi:hypothetical protein
MATKDTIIAELRATIKSQDLAMERMGKRLFQVELKLAKALKDSSNSSKSPSSDIVKPPKKKTTKGKKNKQGAQAGHQRKLREQLPEDRVDETFTYEMDADDVNGQGLTPTDDFEIVQHIELLDFPIHVTEHQLRKYLDRNGKTVLPNVPEVKDLSLFGPRFLAMIGWLKSRGHCSYSTIQTWMRDVLQVPVSRGYLAELCNGEIAASLSDSHEEIKQAVPQQTRLGSDETSLKNNGKKHWIWCLAAPKFTLFHVAPTRARIVLEELIGTEFKGIINFDYFSSNCSFAWHFDKKAQYCWAHLIRDIRFLLKHPDGKTKKWGGKLLNQAKNLFSTWHASADMNDGDFQSLMEAHRDHFLKIIRKPPDKTDAINLMNRFQIVEVTDGSQYDMSQDYFRFITEKNVEPTNNHAEQQIRHCVIDRRITQGTRSAAGQRYHERMWTAIATCTKQGRSFFSFLHESISAHQTGKTPPSLLFT